jgi:hypothetical protein
MELKVGLKMPFCTFCKEIQESSPYMYAFERCNNNVCEQVLRDAYNKRLMKIKAGETYALSVKTGQFSLGNQIIRFYQ